MEKIQCIIIDDEPASLEFTEILVRKHFSHIHIHAVTTDPEEALTLLQSTHPQLVFLDIDMPGISGFELLKQAEPLTFEVIFITAYNEYAIQAFDFNAVGYITKPVETEKFVQTVNKALQRITEKQHHQHLFSLLDLALQTKNTPGKIPLATSKGLLFINIADITYCESKGNYTVFHLANAQPILVSRQLGEYEKLLPETDFCRVHDSYLIHISYLREYIKGTGGLVLLENNVEIPVAKSRKELLLHRYKKWLRAKG